MNKPKHHSCLADNLISVILPTYNSELFIEATLKSVLAQSHNNLKLIVIDDCSSDGTIEIIEAFMRMDSRIQLIRLDVNSGGPAKPRNEGLKYIKGSYIAFIDSDDIWHPSKLALQLKVMISNKLNFSSTRLVTFENENDIELCYYLDDQSFVQVSHNKLLKKNTHAASSVMLTSELAKYLNFPQSSEYVAIEDYCAWLNLHQRPEINSVILSQKLLFYRKHSASISNSKLMMAIKIFQLLNNYQHMGSSLGVKKYYYFITYLIGAMRSEISK